MLAVCVHHCARGLSQVRCCSDTQLSDAGWTKNAGCSVWGGSDEGFECAHDQTFAQAEAICAGVGARLCTIAELEAGCAGGTGCVHDQNLVWGVPTSSRPVACGQAGFCSAEVAGLKDVNDLHEVRLQQRSIYIPSHTRAHECWLCVCLTVPAASQVRCCSDTPLSDAGWTKNWNCLVWGGSDEDFECAYDQTFAQAEAICAEVGARLCTIAELEAGCAGGTGCGHDENLVWGVME